MEELLSRGLTAIENHAMRRVIAEKYNWNRIAGRTLEVYKKALNPQIDAEGRS
jgi:glycosyltransferase involved in cell wall biosynthesis